MTSKLKYLGACSLLPFAVLGATPAFAEGTAAGTDITNSVTVNFEVGGVAQTAEVDSDTFVVDRKINLTVSEVGGATTTVSPGETDAVTTFTVQNTSNATLDFQLSVAQGSAAHGGTDNFDVSNLTVFVDSNDNGVYDVGTDIETFIDELDADEIVTVFVLGDVDLAQVSGDVSGVVLTATAREGGTAAALGAAVTETVGADDASVVDTVFADGIGETDGDRDAAHSANDDYTVAAADIAVSKISRVIDDPFNGTTDPKAIPGATVEYCIAVANASGSAEATDVAISDSLPVTVTYDVGFGILVDGTITGSFGSHTCNADGTAGGDFTDPVVSGTLASVDGGETRTIVFRVTVD